MSGALPLRCLETAALSDVGRVRTENQDACADLQRQSGERLLVVADGMGGHRGGSIASRLALEAIEEVFQRGDLSGSELLSEALDVANRRVHDAASNDPGLHGMGTTIVAVLFEDRLDGAWIAHVGDSRLYRLRGSRVEQLTEDHSAVAELVRRGVITKEEAETHPRRNEILRSLGVLAEVEPSLARIDLREGDQVLLCSDGLSGVLSDDEIAGMLLQAEPTEAVRGLVDSVNARGAPDNVTVVIGSIPLEEITDLVPVAPDPHTPAPPRADVRRVAAATAAVATLLAILLSVLLFQLFQSDGSIGGGDGSRLAAPVDAGPDVAAPPDERFAPERGAAP